MQENGLYGSFRVHRGGYCLSEAAYCAVSSRSFNSPHDYYTGMIGFRVVLAP
jgi:formylglycine-generating enzyme required for sulfatase activity